MSDSYDFKDSRTAGSPAGAKKAREQFSVTIPAETAAYFRAQSEDTGIPVESLMGLCLTDCAKHGRRPDLNWR